ncbi:MAG: aspartate/glutamate racemase family protein [Pseudomonadota bacterium]
MHIGLIGGIGPAATDFYYRQIIEQAAAMGHALDLTMVHADTTTLLSNMAENRVADQCAIYHRLADRLKSAGAQCVVVTSISGHFCIDEFAEDACLPVIDLTKILSDWLHKNGFTTVGILGTDTVMASGMFGKLAPVTVVAPQGEALSQVHDAYVALARSGKPTAQARDVFERAALAMEKAGAQGILLGGTDLNVMFDGTDTPFAVIDCARLHIDALMAQI